MRPIHTRRFVRAAAALACVCVAACAAPQSIYSTNPYGLGDGGVKIRTLAVVPVIGPVQWLETPNKFAVRDAGGVAVSQILGDALLLEAARFSGFSLVSPSEVASVSPGAPGWTSKDGASSLAHLLEADAVISIRVTSWNPGTDLRLSFDLVVTLAEPITTLGEVDVRSLMREMPGMTRNVAQAYQREVLYAASYTFEIRTPQDTAALQQYEVVHRNSPDGSLAVYRDHPFPSYFRYCFYRAMDDVIRMEAVRQGLPRTGPAPLPGSEPIAPEGRRNPGNTFGG